MLKQFGLVLAALFSSAAVNGATLTYNLAPFTGDSLAVRVIFDDAAVAGRLTATVEVDNTINAAIGDLRGIFFNLQSLGSGVSLVQVSAAISGAQITARGTNTSNLGGGNNVNPRGPYSIALAFGTPGLGGDDISTTTFTIDNSALASPVLLSNLAEVAVRATSVGSLPSRTGSSKLYDLSGELLVQDPSGIPEPSTYALLASGLMGLVLLARRNRASKVEEKASR